VEKKFLLTVYAYTTIACQVTNAMQQPHQLGLGDGRDHRVIFTSSQQPPNTALLQLLGAATWGDTALAQEALTQYKAPINGTDLFGRTALHFAVSHPALIQFFLQNGALPNLPDHNQQTALHYACQQVTPLDIINHTTSALLKTIMLLLCVAPEKPIHDKDGKTALDYSPLLRKALGIPGQK